MVVKFMVKVRLIEKSVKSQVGTVIVAKPITQNSRLGTVWKMKTSRRPTTPGIASPVGGTDGRVRGVISGEAEKDTDAAAADKLSPRETEITGEAEEAPGSDTEADC